MKKIVIYTLISFIFSVFVSSCEDNKDNSLFYPDFTWDTGDDEEDEETDDDVIIMEEDG